jgi:DivIVA domain-containing protein
VTLALVLLSVAVALGAVAVARGQVRGGLEPATTSRAHRPLPEGAMTPQDVDAVRLTVALRGYRMDEVETVLDRLRDELAARDARVEALERLAGTPPEPGRSPEPGTGSAPGPRDGDRGADGPGGSATADAADGERRDAPGAAT